MEIACVGEFFGRDPDTKELGRERASQLERSPFQKWKMESRFGVTGEHDRILSEAPFNPQSVPPAVPSVLTVGTSAPVVVSIYDEDPNPVRSKKITGELITTVRKSTTAGPSGEDLHLYWATAVVRYRYRGKDYRVQLNAMRASDV